MFTEHVHDLGRATICLAMTICACSSSPDILVPAELVDGETIALGRSVDEMPEADKLLHSNSIDCYYTHDFDGVYFQSVYYYPGGLWDCIEVINMEGPPKTGDNDADSLARLIVAQCVAAFGKDYTIVDCGPPYLKSLRPPMLVWESDTCAVTFTFTASVLQEQHRQKRIVGYEGYSLELSYELPERDASKPPSTRWTRDSLGL